VMPDESALSSSTFSALAVVSFDRGRETATASGVQFQDAAVGPQVYVHARTNAACHNALMQLDFTTFLSLARQE
jgi:hypothetical protein